MPDGEVEKFTVGATDGYELGYDDETYVGLLVGFDDDFSVGVDDAITLGLTEGTKL